MTRLENILFSTLVGVTIGGLTVVGLKAFEQDTTRKVVYKVCQETRTTNKSEQACGDIQDITHTEYLCKDANKSLDNKCWVEIK